MIDRSHVQGVAGGSSASSASSLFRPRSWTRLGPLLVAAVVIMTLRSLAVHADVTAALEAEEASKGMDELRSAVAQRDAQLAKKEAQLLKKTQRIDQLEKTLRAKEKELKAALKAHAGRGGGALSTPKSTSPTQPVGEGQAGEDDTARASAAADEGGGSGDPDEKELEAREAEAASNLASEAAEEEEAAVWADLEENAGTGTKMGGVTANGTGAGDGVGEKERRRMEAYRKHRAEVEAAEQKAELERAAKAKLDAKIAKAQGPKHWKEMQEHLRQKAEQEKELAGLDGTPQKPATDEEIAAADAAAAEMMAAAMGADEAATL